MRKGLAAAGAVLASVFVAGCGGGLVGGEQDSPAVSSSVTPPPTSESSVTPPPTSETKESERTVPAKSLTLADQCSIVSEDQARSFGADQPPEASDFNGATGCDYTQGVSGVGLRAFVGIKKDETMQEWAEMRSSSVEATEVAEYPAVIASPSEVNCYISVDVSDQGSLFISTGTTPQSDVVPCDAATKFAEAAVKNLPDA